MQCHIKSKILCGSTGVVATFQVHVSYGGTFNTKRDSTVSTDMMSVPTSKIPTVYSRNANDNFTRPSCS
jgi:hypothetical protein